LLQASRRSAGRHRSTRARTFVTRYETQDPLTYDFRPACAVGSIALFICPTNSANRSAATNTLLICALLIRSIVRASTPSKTLRIVGLNGYRAGILVLQVQLQSVDPPEQVIAAFKDVTAAQQDQNRLRNEAEAYANRVVPEARGKAAAIVQEAEGYKLQTVAQATGQVSRFNQIYEQYKKAPEVTRERLYLETMERVLAGTDKIILDQSGGQGQGVVPYLPLGPSPGLAWRSSGSPAS